MSFSFYGNKKTSESDEIVCVLNEDRANILNSQFCKKADIHAINQEEMIMKKIGSTTVFTAIMLLFSFNNAFADSEGLPADRVITAIQTAIAANPGLIHEVEVEQKFGKLIVEVKVIDAKGQKIKVKVDPEKNEVIR